jgi:hypothetical protein
VDQETSKNTKLTGKSLYSSNRRINHGSEEGEDPKILSGPVSDLRFDGFNYLVKSKSSLKPTNDWNPKNG